MSRINMFRLIILMIVLPAFIGCNQKLDDELAVELIQADIPPVSGIPHLGEMPVSLRSNVKFDPSKDFGAAFYRDRNQRYYNWLIDKFLKQGLIAIEYLGKESPGKHKYRINSTKKSEKLFTDRGRAILATHKVKNVLYLRGSDEENKQAVFNWKEIPTDMGNLFVKNKIMRFEMSGSGEAKFTKIDGKWKVAVKMPRYRR